MQKFLLLSIACLLSQITQAQDKPELIVKLSSDTIVLGNYFSVQIQLWNEEETKFLLPVMDEAEVQLISNSSYQKTEETKEEWILKIIPYYEGTYYLPKMNIKLANNQKINIDAIKYTVIPAEDEPTEVQCERISPLTLEAFEYTETKKGLFKRTKIKTDEG